MELRQGLRDPPGAIPPAVRGDPGRPETKKRRVFPPLSQSSSSLEMAGPTGLEPATSGVTGLRSNQLNYDPVSKDRPLRADAHYTQEPLRRKRAERPVTAAPRQNG